MRTLQCGWHNLAFLTQWLCCYEGSLYSCVSCFVCGTSPLLLLLPYLQVSVAAPLQGVQPGGAHVAVLCVASSLGIALLAAPRAGPDPLTLW
jgi:hypothetical protein